MNRIISNGIARHPVLAICLFAFLLFSLGSIGTEITRINIRFGLMTEEMATHPIGIFPTVNGYEYADYLSPYNYLSYLCSIGARFLNQWTLVLPTILLGTLTIGITAAIGEKIEKNLGICAAAMLLLSFEFLNICLGFSIDMPVAAAAAAMIWFLQKYDCSAKGILPFSLLLIFSFAMRGPLGLILPGAAAAGYLIGNRKWKPILPYAVAGGVVTFLCCLALYFLILRQGGETLWKTVLQWQIGSRMKEGNPIYYFTNPMGSFAPLTILMIVTLVLRRRELLQKTLAPIILWALLPMILLSIPGCKHLRYMTLCIPAFALIAAYGYSRLDEDKSKPAQWVGKILLLLDLLMYPAALLTFVGLLIAGLILSPAIAPYIHFIGGILLATVLWIVLRRYSEPRMRIVRLALLFVTIVSLGIFPFDSMIQNAEVFASRLEEKRQGQIYLYEMGPDHDDLKYILHTRPERRKDVVYLFEKPLDPNSHAGKMYPMKKASSAISLLGSQDLILLQKRKLHLLTATAKAAGKNVEIADKGNLGHREFLAVRLTTLP